MYISLWIDCLFEIRRIAVFPLAFIAGWLQGHWWGFIIRNYVVWPTFLLMNIFIALKGSHFWFLFSSLEEMAEQKCGTELMSHHGRSRQSGDAEAELHIIGSQGSVEALLQIFGSQRRAEVRKRNFRFLAVKQNFISLTSHYPTDCHCQCWRITLLTAIIIVIPNEGQCEDYVWLKHRTFTMLLTRSLC